MSEKGTAKRIVIDVSDIEILKTPGGRFFAPDPLGGLSELTLKSDGKAQQISEVLRESEKLNSPGGTNFEAAKALLEQYRMLALLCEDSSASRFDISASGADKNAVRPDPAGAKGPAVSGLLTGEMTAAQLTELLDCGLERMLDSSSTDILDAGELLYARYVKPEYSSKQTEFFMALFKCSRATYFRLLNRATGILSRLIFGM